MIKKTIIILLLYFILCGYNTYIFETEMQNKDIKINNIKKTKQPSDKIMQGIKSYKCAVYDYKENKIVYYVDENNIDIFIEENKKNEIKINKYYIVPTPTITATVTFKIIKVIK
jgi:hypothetical protein